MAMIQLDANYLVAVLDKGSEADRRLRGWLADGQQVAMSSVALAEFLCGPLSETDEREARTILPEALPLLTQDAELAAHLFNETGRRTRSLRDCMIAATALHHGAILATYNRADFRRFASHGLKLLPES